MLREGGEGRGGEGREWEGTGGEGREKCEVHITC